MNKRILENYNLVNSIIEKTEDKELKVLSAFLGDRIRNIDSYVLMLGETSSGKSSIINGLMDENTLFVSSTPSTGSITEVEFKDEIRNLLVLISSESLYFEDIPLRLLDYANATDILTVIILIVNVKEYISESKVIPLNLSKNSFMSTEEYKKFMNSISESYIRIYDFDEEVRKKIEEDLKL